MRRTFSAERERASFSAGNRVRRRVSSKQGMWISLGFSGGRCFCMECGEDRRFCFWCGSSGVRRFLFAALQKIHTRNNRSQSKPRLPTCVALHYPEQDAQPGTSHQPCSDNDRKPARSPCSCCISATSIQTYRAPPSNDSPVNASPTPT